MKVTATYNVTVSSSVSRHEKDKGMILRGRKEVKKLNSCAVCYRKERNRKKTFSAPVLDMKIHRELSINKSGSI